MIGYVRNPEVLKTAIREHTISDYLLSVPIFDLAKGVSTSIIRGLTSVLVEPIQPLHIDEVGNRQRWSIEKHDLEYWRGYGSSRTPKSPLGWMHPRSVTVLQEGYSLSMRDIQEMWLKALGHIDADRIVRRYSFNLDQVSMDSENIHPGMVVEFVDTKSETSYVGRVYGTGADPQDGKPLIYLEPFTPVPAFFAPKAISPWVLNDSMIADKTWVLGPGTVAAMKRKRIKLPKGKYDPKDDREQSKKPYFLDQPIPISRVTELCEKYFPGQPICSWQSMVLLVLPLHPAAYKEAVQGPKRPKEHPGGMFRPYPDDVNPTEIEAEIDYFTQEMEFEE